MTTPKLRPGLPPLPDRIARLPIDSKWNMPTPFFVSIIDGKPDFRIADSAKLERCVRDKLCWICGETMGKYLSFVIGPMCTINRLSADPFMHRECSEWSVQACPFMLNPGLVRREDERTKSMEGNVKGVMIKRNPGVMAIWTTLSVNLERVDGGILFRLGDPEHISWWREGRKATRAEILESMQSGLPLLEAECCNQKEALMLQKATQKAMLLVCD